MLGNVEAKLFWRLTAQIFYQDLVTRKNLIDTTLQKGTIWPMEEC